LYGCRFQNPGSDGELTFINVPSSEHKVQMEKFKKDNPYGPTALEAYLKILRMLISSRKVNVNLQISGSVNARTQTANMYQNPYGQVRKTHFEFSKNLVFHIVLK
jgi:hypothetical protein